MKIRKSFRLFAGSAALIFYAVNYLHADDIQVIVTTSTQAIQLPPLFLGLSYEKDSLHTQLWRADDTNLIALYNRLGPSILRIAGDSVDHDKWDPNGLGKTWGTIIPRNVNDLDDFLKATQWKVIYAVSMGSGTPPTSAAEAAYASTTLGDRIYGIEIGNEPDKYVIEGYRPSTFTAAEYNVEWSVFAQAVLAKTPHGQFVGPDAGYVAGYIPAFASAQKNIANLLTYHHYGYHDPSVTNTNQLIQILLAPNKELANIYVQGNTSVTTNHISRGWRMDESNTYSTAADGISNGQVSALWAIDYMFDLARHGDTGVCFTGGFDDITPNFTPIADDGKGNVTAVMPLYYAMYLFSMVNRGTLMDTTVSASTPTLSANAVTMPNGSISVILDNKDASQSDQVTIQLPGTVMQASTLLLTAPSLTSKNATTLGGAPININGSWNPQPDPIVSAVNNQITVTIPPASAMLIQTPSVTSSISNLNPANGPLSNPKVYPNPWRADGRYASQIIFTQIPAGTAIHLFTISGHEVASLTAGSDGTALWNLQNKSGHTVASGIYVYTLSDNQGNKARGKLAIIK